MKNPKYYIDSMEGLRQEQQNVRSRIRSRENELRKRVHQIPGELFYSGVDSVIPSFLSGKVSSFALNAGKGLINNFFVRKAARTGGTAILNVLKPSGILRKAGSVIRSVIKRK
jgi:hypothetical protein